METRGTVYMLRLKQNLYFYLCIYSVKILYTKY